MRVVTTLALVASALTVPALTVTPSASASHPCVLQPEMRGTAAVTQGLPYANLVRGKETLIRLYLSESAECNGEGSVYLTGVGSAQVLDGTTTLPEPIGSGTMFAPTSKQALPNPYTTAPPQNAPHDPLFVIPGEALRPAAGTPFTALFRLGVQYTTSASSELKTRTFEVTASYSQRSKALRILVQPLGDGTRTASEQYAYTTDPGNTTYVSTDEVMQSAFQSLSRQLPVSDGVVPTLDQSLGRGGIRWGVAPTVFDVSKIPGAYDSQGRFCANIEVWNAMQPGLQQKLVSWNADNPTRLADRIVGVIDSRITSTNSCFAGFGAFDGLTSFVIARPDSESAGRVSPTGGLLTMELTHNFGLRLAANLNSHSTFVHADETAPGRAYNVTMRKQLPRLENHSAMLNSDSNSYYTEDNTLLEDVDQRAVLCGLGGAVATPCGATSAGGTTFGVGAGPTFFMTGSTDGTPGGTRVTESFFSTDTAQCQPLTTGRSSSCAPSAGSPYRLLQIAGQSTNVLANHGVAITTSHDGHGDHEQNADHLLSAGTFSIAFQGYQDAGRIQLYYCSPSLGDLAQAGCKENPRASGTLLYDRSKQPAPPSVTSTTVTRGGSLRQATHNPAESDRSTSLSYDGSWLAWSRVCDTEPTAPCVDGVYVAPVSNPSAMTALPTSAEALETMRDPAWNPQGTAIAYVDPGARQLYLQPISTGGRAVTFGQRRPLLAVDASTPAPLSPTFSPDGLHIVFEYGGDIAQVPLVAGPSAKPQLLVATTAEESAPSASRTSGDPRIAYTSRTCMEDPNPEGGKRFCFPDEVHSVHAKGGDVRVLGTGNHPSYGDDGRVIFRDYGEPGLSSVDTNGQNKRRLTTNETDSWPAGSSKGVIAFSRSTPTASSLTGVPPSSDEVFITNQSQSTVTATASSSVPNLLVGDLTYECRGTRYPVSVGVRPTSVQDNAATFEAVFDESLACGGEAGSLYFQITDGVDRTAGTTTAQATAVADKSPVAGIMSPRDGSDLGPLETLVLNGGGRDAEAGEVGLSWSITTSDGATRKVGDGAHVDVRPPAGGWPSGALSVTLTSTDGDGRTGTSTRRVNVKDSRPPAITVTHVADGANGWSTTSSVPLTVTVNDSDGRLSSISCSETSGPLTTTPTSPDGSTYSGTVTVSGDGAHVVTCTATDSGGNTATAGDTVRIDTVMPRLSSTQSPQPNADGWNSGDVTVTFACSDDGSGVARLSASGAAAGASTSSPLAVTVSSDGVHGVGGRCDDVAGNTAAATAAVQIDRALPDVSVTAPRVNAVYSPGQAVQTEFSCTDGLSGIAGCTGPGALDTGTTGPKSATFRATDRAGNVRTVSVPYKVTWVFEGFFQPIDNPPTVNSGKAGRTYPVKWRLKNSDGSYVTSVAAVESIRYAAVSCSTWLGNPLNAIETSSSGATSLRNSDGTFIYDWQSPSTPGCYVLYMTVADGLDTTYTAHFNLGLS